MGTHERRNSDLLDVVKSWFQWRSEPANVSRNFWMPDDSCVVCYECDSQFTVFNRKHHCRKCGRVFCSRCSANFVPVESNDDLSSLQEEGEKVRVCNYCFKQWEESLVAGNDAQEVSCPVVSSSISKACLRRSKSSSRIFASVPYIDGVTERVHYRSAPSLGQFVHLEGMSEEKGDMEVSASLDRVRDDFMYRFSNRSDDDDYEYGECYSDSDSQRFSGRNDYHGQNNFNVEQNDGSKDIHSTETVNDDTDIESSIHDNAQQHATVAVDKLEGLVVNNGDDSNASSTIWGVENMENNWLLWEPPLPEDEDDEKESILSDDDECDNEDKANKWHEASSSSSFASSEYRHKNRFGEEHKRAMKSLVGGHFRALVAQLLQVENIPAGEGDGKENWLDIITSLSWEAAFLLKPDTSSGGGMDPGLYVKVKCLACGRPSDSVLVKGVVCKKNVAHRRMTSKIEKPRILILGGALEYQRVPNALSSFDTLLQQEMDHLKMAVAKIASHHPNVLLVEKSVPRFAQEYLLAKNISLVLNIKRSLLERIARCTGAQIVPSIDHLLSPKLGHCDLFHVEKFFEEHGSAGQGGKKLIATLMFFEGCPKPLGYTILLKGASGDELKRIKHVVHYGVFAAYHLALETSFLADEGASLPELPLQSPITVALPDKPSSINRSITTIVGFSMSSNGVSQSGNSLQRSSISDLNPDFESYDKTHGSELLVSQDCSAYPVFNLDPPIEDSDVIPASCLGDRETLDTDGPAAHNEQKCSVEMIDGQQQCSSDIQLAHQDNTRDDQEFASSSDHKSILVSLSSRCVWKGTVCEQTHLLRIKFYGTFDKPLGRYLRDCLFDQSYRCQCCEMPSEAHVYCYTHRQGSLTISVRKLPNFLLPGERVGKIWMWHRCLRCPTVNGFPPATRRVVMSEAAWGLSFGKFLELSFSNHAAASGVASCGHSLHRDCLRFYGCGSMVACFRYAPINVNSVYLPPPKLDFFHQNQDWVQKEANEVADNAELLFTEVLNSLRLIVEQKERANTDSNMKVELRKSICQLELMLQKEKTEFEESLQKATKDGKYAKSFIDVLEITKLQRKLLFQSYIWDKRLVFASYCCNNTEEKVTDLVTRNKENSVPTLSINFETLETSLPDSKDSESLNCGQLSAPVEDQFIQYEKPCENKQNGNVEDEHIHREQSKDRLSSNLSARDEVDALESGLSFHRVISDSQFKNLGDLSNTLDAKWTGESGPAAPDGNKLKAIGLPEDAVQMLISYEFEELSGSDISEAKLGQIAGILIKLPFSDLYNAFNKISYTLPRYDNWIEYSPKYVHLFKKLMDQGGRRLLFPLGVNDTVVPVYDDEPTSIIAYALVCPDYHHQISDELETPADGGEKQDLRNIFQQQSVDGLSLESIRGTGSLEDSIGKSSLVLDPLSSTKAMHVRVPFPDDGKMKYSVTCYYSKRFDALRRICCPTEIDFIRSLSRCKKWGAQGGKSNVFFAKTLDDRFIIKQVTKTELESFIRFAPEYFKYLSESIQTGSPTCLAKILGIYQVTVRNLTSGKETRMDLLVMENLLFGRKVTRVYDLKGSSRSRYNADPGGKNKVLLDQNLIEAMPTSPIFVGNKAKRLLERAVWNDTSFLASIDVMDYSLLVGVDEENHELVLGIIDFMRQYTWDKHLETWVKASGILGGPRNEAPTVISPKQYKKRFRKAMSTYFLVVPDDWSPPTIPSNLQPALSQERTT